MFFANSVVFFSAIFITFHIGAPKDLGCFEDDTILRLLNHFSGTFVHEELKPARYLHTPPSKEACVKSCEEKGFPFAGLWKTTVRTVNEHLFTTRDCRCGKNIPSKLAAVFDEDCKKIENCTENCDVLPMRVESTTIPISNETITTARFLGCKWWQWDDNKGEISNITAEECHRKCFFNGFLYFEFKYASNASHCYCTDNGDDEHILKNVKDKDCPREPNKPTSYYGYFYSTGISDYPSANYSLLVGCFKYRSDFLQNGNESFFLQLSRTNSPRRCSNICSQRGLSHSGVSGNYCHCGNYDESKKEETLPYERCTLFKCPGNAVETCGNNETMKVFRNPSRKRTQSPNWFGCMENDEKSGPKGMVQIELDKSASADTCADLCELKEFGFSAYDTVRRDCFCTHYAPAMIGAMTSSDCDVDRECDDSKPCKNPSYERPLIYFTTRIPATDITGMYYWGCYEESSDEKYLLPSRLLNGHWSYFDNLTPKLCHAFCHKEAFLYFGLSEGNECYCGNSFSQAEFERGDEECDIRCSGDERKMCGGRFRLSLYSTGITDIPSLDRYYGCFKNSPNRNFMTGFEIELGSNNSPRRCLNICDGKGFVYAAVQNRKMCYCGNDKPPPQRRESGEQCADFKCFGDASETCGSTEHMKVYRTTVGENSDKSTGYLGCFKDQAKNRILNGYRIFYRDTMPFPGYCTALCNQKKFAFAGLTDGKTCFCGHNSPSVLSRVKEGECSIPCKRDGKCGGVLRTAISFTGRNTIDIENSVSVGCFREESGKANGWFKNRLIDGFWILKAEMRVEMCHSICHKEGYLYFGITDSERLPKLSSQVGEQECRTCWGDVNKLCGALNRFSVYATGISNLGAQGSLVGCYFDSFDDTALTGLRVTYAATNSILRCANICAQRGFKYSGVKNKVECKCGNDILSSAYSSDIYGEEGSCEALVCPGNNRTNCGSKISIKIHNVARPGYFSDCDYRYMSECSESAVFTTTTPAPSTIPVAPNDSCKIPASVRGKNCTTRCDGGTTCPLYADSMAPSNSELICQCGKNYALATATNQAICRKSNWFPFTPSCTKMCPPLRSSSLDFISCSHYGIRVNCSQYARPNTIVSVRCKQNYIAEESALVVRTVTCLKGGTWDSVLHKCNPNCGIGYTNTATRSLTPLLSNSKPAALNEVPWQVALYRLEGKNQSFICGGSIFTPYLVITAAHCVYNEDTKSVNPAEEYSAGVGKRTVQYNTKDAPETKIIKVIKIFVPKEYFGLENLFAYDIAILELAENIKFSSNIMPVCVNLSPNLDDPPEKIGRLAGWGRTRDGAGGASEVLLTAEMPYLTKQECRTHVSEVFIQYILQPDKFCAGSRNGSGAQLGDSGGGLVFRDGYQYFIYGIVSYKESSGVQSAVSSFTRMYSHLTWIDDVNRQVKKRREF